MIKIEKPRIENKEGKSYLIATVEIPKEATEKLKEFSNKGISYSYIRKDYHLENNKFDLWYQVPEEYGKYFCDDRVDGFVVAMLYYAMVTGENIETKFPVSKKLMFNLNDILIPTLCNKYTGIKKIYINRKRNNRYLSDTRKKWSRDVMWYRFFIYC